MNAARFCLIAVAILTVDVAASADIYRWVDENGVVQFGDAPPDDAAAEKQQPAPLNQYQSPAGPPDEEPVLDTAPTAETGSVATTEAKTRAATIRCNKTDRNECFDAAEHRVCLMRYSLRCGDLIFWKTIARQNCEAERRQDCADPARILERRPMGMLLRDLDAPLPLIGHVSSDDFACLNKHGFFCNELTNEDWCQEAYGTSCATLSGWAENLPEKCRQQRADWCDDPVHLYDEYRPRSIEEVQRRGTRIRHGGLAVRDRLFINSDVRGSDDSRSQDLTDLLQRFPGM